MSDSENSEVIAEYSVSENNRGSTQANLTATSLDVIGARAGDKIQVRSNGDGLYLSVKDREPIAYIDTDDGRVPIYDKDQVVPASEVEG